MNKSLSIYFDLLRSIAACLVVLGHFSWVKLSGDYFNFFGHFHHDAVIIFFVLSGFVIAYVAENKDPSFRRYLLSRLSRLFSVVLPALVLTIMLDQVGLYVNSEIYEGRYLADEPVWRFIANLFFIQQAFGMDVRPFSNGPFWSLSYEFWYYMIFACVFYFEGKRRIFFTVICCFIAGPKILILLPIWWSGVKLYNKTKNNTEYSKHPSGTLLLLIVILVLYFIYKFTVSKSLPRLNLDHSSKFLHYYIVAVFAFYHIYFVRAISHTPQFQAFFSSEIVKKPIHFISAASFSIYLYHFPLLIFWRSILNTNTQSLYEILGLLFITFISIFLLAEVTEKKKHLYKELLIRLFPFLGGKSNNDLPPRKIT